jgi:TolB-like protein
MERGLRQLALRQDQSCACISLFGAFRLTTEIDGEIPISNRRAKALLAVLCLNGSEPVEREQLSKLLWPGRFESHARASLRQCLLDLGKLLEPVGSDILHVTRHSVCLNSAAIATDLGDLEAALSDGNIVEAAHQLSAIGTAPLVDQMDFGEAFNAWLTHRRAQAEQRLQIAVDRALTAATQRGDMGGHKALTHAWALRHPSPSAEVTIVGTSADTRARIAVLPFQSLNAKDGDDYFADGIVDEMITTLGQVPQLLVAGRTSSFHFRRSDLASLAIAQALGVAHLIEGSVQRQGEKIRIFVRLIDGVTGFESWGQRYDGSLDDIFALQETVAQAVTAALAENLGIMMRPPLVRGLTHSKKAYDLYLQGRALNARLWGDGVLTRAAELLDEAVALDPGFAEAWVLLGDVHQRMGIYLAGTDQTKAAAMMAECVSKAVAIKPGLGMAYGLLALHQMTRNDIVGCLDLAFKGYEVEPSNPAVAVRLGTLLLICGLTRRGMHYVNEAVDQDPADGRNYMCRSAGQLNLGNIDAAIADAQRCVDLGFPSMWLGVAHAAAGNHDLAVDCYQQTRAMINNSIPPPSGMTPMPPEMRDAYWLVAAKGVCSGKAEDRDAYCKTLDFLHATMIDKEHTAITMPAVFMGHADLLFKTIGTRITLGNIAGLLSIWTEVDPMCRIWQHEEFIPFAQRIGMAAAWDKYGWPDLLPPPSNL